MLEKTRERVRDWIAGGCDHDHKFVKDLGISFCVFSQNYHNYQLYVCVKCGEELRHHDLNGPFYTLEEIMQTFPLDNIEDYDEWNGGE